MLHKEVQAENAIISSMEVHYHTIDLRHTYSCAGKITQQLYQTLMGLPDHPLGKPS